MQSTSPTDSGHYNFLYARYSGNDLLKFKKLRMENPQLTHARGESPTVAVRCGSSILGEGGEGEGGIWAREGERKETPARRPLFCSNRLLI